MYVWSVCLCVSSVCAHVFKYVLLCLTCLFLELLQLIIQFGPVVQRQVHLLTTVYRSCLSQHSALLCFFTLQICVLGCPWAQCRPLLAQVELLFQLSGNQHIQQINGIKCRSAPKVLCSLSHSTLELSVCLGHQFPMFYVLCLCSLCLLSFWEFSQVACFYIVGM